MTTLPDATLSSALSNSVMFRTYQEAFERATGLSLDLLGLDEIATERSESGNPFCALMNRTDRACETCHVLQRKLAEESKVQPKTLKCFAGLCETAVPVLVGETLIAFLRTGKVLVETPNHSQFTKIAEELRRLDANADLKTFEEAYYKSRVLTAEQYEAMVRLLSIFSTDLAACGNQLMLRRSAQDDLPIIRAKLIIADTFRGELPLRDIAKRVGVSTTYFSMLFKRTTGLNFIDYVARLRVEEAKNLLQNPKYRIREVA